MSENERLTEWLLNDKEIKYLLNEYRHSPLLLIQNTAKKQYKKTYRLAFAAGQAAQKEADRKEIEQLKAINEHNYDETLKLQQVIAKKDFALSEARKAGAREILTDLDKFLRDDMSACNTAARKKVDSFVQSKLAELGR